MIRFVFERCIAAILELYQITRPSRSSNLRKGVLCAFRPAKASPFVQPLRHRLRDATSPCRGGFGIAENFSSSPEAPLLGELSNGVRLRGCTKTGLPSVARPALLRPVGPQASSKKWPGLPMALPLGELSPKVTERARTLTENRRRSDSIALPKSQLIAAKRLRGLPLHTSFPPRIHSHQSKDRKGASPWS